MSGQDSRKDAMTHVFDMTPEQKAERVEAYRRVLRFWLWGRDIHVTLFIYSYEWIWVWIMCSCFPYRLLPATPEKHYGQAPFLLEAHDPHRYHAHEYMDQLPISERLKEQIDAVLAKEGSRASPSETCPPI
jgi:hypothetical protein